MGTDVDQKRESDRLVTELQFFAANKSEWLKAHRGSFVVVQFRHALGFYPSFEQAFRAGVASFGVQRDFLVKQVLPQEPIYYIFQSVFES